ncbi:hypothetical protein SDJN03_03839, partial [Cucurbita argyrosperma subsp. sororia]
MQSGEMSSKSNAVHKYAQPRKGHRSSCDRCDLLSELHGDDTRSVQSGETSSRDDTRSVQSGETSSRSNAVHNL